MDLITLQGLTPTITVTVAAVDLTEAENIYPSIKQGAEVLRPTIFDVAAHQVDIYLTQAETLALSPGMAELQINWTYATGQRGAIDPKSIRVLPNHLLEVLP